MDLKEQISQAVEKITKDKDLLAQFKEEPVKAIEKVLGVDLPDELVEKVIEGVTSKTSDLGADSKNKLSEALGNIKKLF